MKKFNKITRKAFCDLISSRPSLFMAVIVVLRFPRTLSSHAVPPSTPSPRHFEPRPSSPPRLSSLSLMAQNPIFLLTTRVKSRTFSTGMC